MMTQSLPLTVFSPFDGGNSFCFYKTVSKSKDTSLSLSVHIMDSLILKWGHKKTLLQTNKQIKMCYPKNKNIWLAYVCGRVHRYIFMGVGTRSTLKNAAEKTRCFARGSIPHEFCNRAMQDWNDLSFLIQLSLMLTNVDRRDINCLITLWWVEMSYYNVMLHPRRLQTARATNWGNSTLINLHMSYPLCSLCLFR